jgi:hypothetical protein
LFVFVSEREFLVTWDCFVISSVSFLAKLYIVCRAVASQEPWWNHFEECWSLCMLLSSLIAVFFFFFFFFFFFLIF